MTVAMLLISFYLWFILGFFGTGALDKFSNRAPDAGLYGAVAAGAFVSLVLLYIQVSAM